MISSVFTRRIPDSGAEAFAVAAELGKRKLSALGAWALRTIEALPDGRKSAAGFRDFYFAENGSGEWYFPRSNAAERISVYLALWQQTGQRCYYEAALHYAEAFFDPVYGIYDGPEEVLRGQVYYWYDCGLYMTNYTMRVPPAMFELYDLTGNKKYRDAAFSAGEALLRAQKGNGILLEGYLPEHPVASPRTYDPDRMADWVTDYKINSRIGYAVYAFAVLYCHSGDGRYADALEKLAHALMRLQYEDGSFPQDFPLRRYKPVTPFVKNHFLSYILNGAAAALKLCPDTPHLESVARNLGEYLVSSQRRSWGWPYGNLDELHDEMPWCSSSADASSGLLLLSEVTGESIFAETAAKLLVQALFSMIDLPENPDLHGCMPLWVTSEKACTMPALGGYFHFFSLLGLLKLIADQEKKNSVDPSGTALAPSENIRKKSYAVPVKEKQQQGRTI